MNLKDELLDYAEKIGIDDLKVTSAQPLSEAKAVLKKAKQKGYLSKFVKANLDLLTEPKQTLAEAKSVIVCALSYQADGPKVDKQTLKDELCGRLARFARGKDYHQVFEQKLEQLLDFLKQRGAKGVKFVDTGPTVDRALAKRAGIGWQGKNCSIIHPEYGSWIFIGGIITDLDLAIDQPLEDGCKECNKCIRACPTNALKEPYLLDSRKCLGYITLKKGYLTLAERKSIGMRLWGCDSCQQVCPANQGIISGRNKAFSVDKEEAYPDLTKILTLDKAEYKKRFKDTALYWRGMRPLKRNAAVILGNLKDEAVLPYLLEALEDNKPIVRAHTAWALGEIGVEGVEQKLKRALARENDKEVKKEISTILAEKF